MKKTFALIYVLISTTLYAGIPVSGDYLGPSQTLIQREGIDKIKKTLITKQKIPQSLFPLFESIMKTEDWGHIGYHGANHGFRFYQDVIKITIEEIVKIPVKKDFQFLRIPGDVDLNLNTVDEFVDYWGVENVDNRNDMRSKQLLSLNYGLYSNYKISGSCSISWFSKDKSASQFDYAKELHPLYRKLGIDTNELKKLSAIANKWLGNGNGGVLIQLSEDRNLIEDTGEAYNYADILAYPAKRGGYRVGDKLISIHYETAMSTNYIKKKSIISDQLRLLMNNKYTLNPFSSLIVKRWDLNDKSKMKSYENELRKKIKSLKYDKNKASKFKNELLKQWAS